MKKLLKIQDRAGLTMGPVLLSLLFGSVLTLSATAKDSPLPTTKPGILIVPRQLAPLPQPKARSNSPARTAPVRQLAYTTAAAPPAPTSQPAVNKTGIVIVPAADHTSYVGAYSSIPFSRSEYKANPSYRHEAAMEILFGKLRPMVIHKYIPQASPPQFSFDNYGRYRFGGGRFGGGYRNYNFYYPRPTIYRRY